MHTYPFYYSRITMDSQIPISKDNSYIINKLAIEGCQLQHFTIIIFLGVISRFHMGIKL